MIIIKRKKFFIRIAEVYFAEEIIKNIPDVDIIIFIQISKEYKGLEKYYTLHTNLLEKEEEIFNKIRISTRKILRKAMKENKYDYLVNNNPTNDTILEFADFYNIFAKNKKIIKCNISKLRALQKENALSLSLVKNKEGNVLVFEANVIDNERVRGIYSATHFRLTNDKEKRKEICNANKYLHWMNIKYFKKEGYRIFDYGGVALNKNNIERSNIDYFKRGFGGHLVTEYNYYYSKNILGLAYKIAKLIYDFIKR